MAELIIYRGGAPLTTAHTGENTVYNGDLMGQNKVQAEFDSPIAIAFSIGDYIQHNGHTYQLKDVPTETKLSRNRFRYSAIFEGREYSLYSKQLRNLGSAVFTYFGTAAEILDLILSNANMLDPGWTAGLVDATEPQLVSFNKDSCRSALTKVAEAFKLEYRFRSQVVDLKKSVGEIIPNLTLEYGKGNGLYSISRQPISDKKFGTRFYGYGGSVNLPENYRSGATELQFTGEYIDRNVDKYDVLEVSVVFDQIYPKRTAQITGTPSINSVIDSSLDFDLNAVIVQGQAKIVFKSGDLGGNEFEITKYDHATKTITFNVNKEDNGYILPNNTVKPSIGDTYTLVGIQMPQSYVTAAEAELLAAVTAYADENCDPKHAFGVSVDEKFIRDNGFTGVISVGDRVQTVDADLGISSALRVQSISYPLINPSKITATISDTVSYTVAEQLVKNAAVTNQVIVDLKKSIVKTGRDNAVRLREFQGMVFDPSDGYFDGGKLRPETLEAIHFKSGTLPQDFSLSVIFKPNYQGDANHIQWSAGELVHNTIDSFGIKTWSIGASSRTNLVSGTPYYIYARCPKSGSVDGTIVLDTVKRRANDDDTHYYFLIGMFSSSINGVRWPSLSYGSTEINGRFLTTGRAQSQDGSTYFDFDESRIGGRIMFGNKGASTIIDDNLVSSGTLVLGNGIIDNAGVSGEGTLTTDIRFWAGASYTNRSTAPYRVDQSGRVWMSNAVVSGEINATSGTIGGFQITPGGFGFNGSGVKILPNKGINVYGMLSIPKAAPTVADMEPDEWYDWIGDEGFTGTNPPQIGVFDLINTQQVGTLSNGQVLKYNSTSGKWENSADGGGDLTQAVADGRYLGINATAVNANQWGGLTSNYSSGVQGGGITSLLGVHSNGTSYGFTAGAVRSFLGLGDNAYSSTAYLPLAGGTLTGTPTLSWAAPYMYWHSTAWGTYSFIQTGVNSGSIFDGVYNYMYFAHAGSGFYFNNHITGQSATFSGVVQAKGLISYGHNLVESPTLGYGPSANATLSSNGLYGLYTGVSSAGYVWKQVQRNDGNTTVYGLVLQPAGGGVQIGTTASYGTLTVYGSALNLALQSSSTTGNNYMSFRNYYGTETAYFGQGSTGSNSLYYYLNGADSHYFYANGAQLLQLDGADGYAKLYSWLRLGVGGQGIYSTTNSAHFSPAASTYGTWKINGSRGGYTGVVFEDAGNVSLMYEPAGNGGVFDQSIGVWHFYWHKSNQCLGIGGPNTASGYKARINGALYADGDINAQQVRAKGWFTTGEGHAVEMGVSGGAGHVISYDRTAGAYKPIYFSGSRIEFNTGYVHITAGLSIPGSAPNPSFMDVGKWYDWIE